MVRDEYELVSCLLDITSLYQNLASFVPSSVGYWSIISHFTIQLFNCFQIDKLTPAKKKLHKHLSSLSYLFLSSPFSFEANVFLACGPPFARLDYLPALAAKCVQAFSTVT